VEHKALAKSLQTNTWKYVFDAQDVLRKEVITSTVALDRARENYALSLDDLQLSNTTHQGRIVQLEGTTKSLERTGRKATKKDQKVRRADRNPSTEVHQVRHHVAEQFPSVLSVEIAHKGAAVNSCQTQR
jgi:hypothetical protein